MSARKAYLTGYNLLFASFWISVFINAVTNAKNGKQHLFDATESQARWIQTASLIEVVHSATGTISLRLTSHHNAHTYQA
jgi:very-long-chain (3R)-3-hydroxyacyl-CoA dehydratase